MRDNYEQEISEYEAALVAVREKGDQRGEIEILDKLGQFYSGLLLDYQKSADLCQQAIAIAREIKDKPVEADFLHRLGVSYWYLKNRNQSIQCDEQALAIAREIGDQKSEIIYLTSLGRQIYKYRKDYAQALVLFQQALAIAHKIGDRHGEAANLHELSNVYKRLGDYRQAIEYIEQFLTLFRQTESEIEDYAVIYSDYEKQIAQLRQKLGEQNS